MKKLSISVFDQKSKILVGTNITAKLVKDPFLKDVSSIFVFCDNRVKKSSLKVLTNLKRTGKLKKVFWLNVNESLKNLSVIEKWAQDLAELGADRKSLLIAIGGGVVGDACGFLAGIYMRGIQWVGIPTTVLAQVDSSVGGKCAVNTKSGKNILGVFHQPSLVICDSVWFKTLSSRDMISGMGEVLKYGLVYDWKFFEHVLLKRDIGSEEVFKCLKWKCAAVQKDVKDTKGIREVLNFGHTIGHAIEKVYGYRKFRHGEAVLLGMQLAIGLSVLKHHLKLADGKNFLKKLQRITSSVKVDKINWVKVAHAVKFDKKSLSGKVRFILLTSNGKTVIDTSITPHDIFNAAKLANLA